MRKDLDNVATMRPRLFIGSSSEGLPIAEAFQAALDPAAQPKLWTRNVFEAGGSTLSSLLKEASETSFALMVLTAEDVTQSRQVTAASPRDNVVFELGVFLGRLGAGRVFFAHEHGAQIKIPSDLLGISAVTWRSRDDQDWLNAVGPAAREMVGAMRRLGSLEAPASAPASVDLVRRGVDALEAIVNGAAGMRPTLVDEPHATRWTSNVLAMCLDQFQGRSDDIYAVWLRPTGDPDELLPYQSKNMPAEHGHHPFRRGEGLAGKVWTTGRSAASSSNQPHEWWEPREGCVNHSYACTGVGDPGGRGGVLAIGSDEGFEIADGDLQVLRLFAAMLGVSVAARPQKYEDLIRRLEVLDRDLTTSASGQPAPAWSVAIYNAVRQLARDTIADDVVLKALPEADTTFTAVGIQQLAQQLRLSIEAAR